MKQKINIGIIGYGNLGKSVEKTVISSKNMNLVAIFSRREIISPVGTLTEPYFKFKEYVGKIDVMLLCGGSKSDLEIQTPEVAKYFDVINTFDTHAKIAGELKRLDAIAKKYKRRVIMSCGWDPGLFSVIRAMFYAIGRKEPITFWGRGISMGHSDAIRRVPGVRDGVQFTIPNPKALALARAGKEISNMPLHFRECFVCCEPNDEKRIEKEIKSTPNYFKGQPTTIDFVDEKTIKKLKKKMAHKGEVISCFITPCGSKCRIKFSAKMASNPDFTAAIMCAYVNAIINLKNRAQVGALTNLDVAPSDLFDSEEKILLLERFC